MTYSKSLAERIGRQVAGQRKMETKKMFGGIGYLLNGNLCFGVWKNSLVVRVGPQHYTAALAEPHVGKFDITGRAMTGWVLVAPEGVEHDAQLQKWIEHAITFVTTLPPK